MIGLLGIVLLLGIAYGFSVNRTAIRWKTVLGGLALQVVLALFVLKLELGKTILNGVAQAVTRLIAFADRGSGFLFGSLAGDPENYIFAFKILPIVVFVSSLFAILYYLGIMQLAVFGMARVMHRLMGVSGAESLAAAANVFVGQTEAPIMVGPYIPQMTDSELMALMTGGMATISGALLGGYMSLGINAEYLISASLLAAPASLVMAKIIIPETEVSKTSDEVALKIERTDVNVIDAAARGAAQGAILAINVGAMLIAFIAIIYLVNGVLSEVGHLTGLDDHLGAQLTLQLTLGYLMAPIVFLMGVPWSDAFQVGQLVGVKVVLNEFVAYVDLVALRPDLSVKSEMIATYALCGFANLGSIGIQIGGIGSLAPGRKSDLARLGLRSVLAGSLASFMTATLVGLLL